MIDILKLVCRDSPTLDLEEYLAIFNILAGDEEIAKLEEAFAKYINNDYAVAFPSGRTAQYAIYRGLAERREIIVPALGCIPLADSVTWSGNRARFADINLDTYNIDAECVKKLINEKTTAIAPVHLYGLPADLDPLVELKDKYDLTLIEDAAMAPGAEYKGRKVGSIGDAAIFSFDRSKVISSYRGGIATTNSEKIYKNLLAVRSEFKKKLFSGRAHLLRLYFYKFVTNPYIWNVLFRVWSAMHEEGTANIGTAEQPMPESQKIQYSGIQANVALKQLRKIERFIGRRREIAHYYTKSLGGIEGLVLPRESGYSKHIFARYVVRVDKFKMDRDTFRQELLKHGVDPGLFYRYSLPYTNFYKEINDVCPVALKVTKEVLTLPNHPSMSDSEMRHVVESVLDICRK